MQKTVCLERPIGTNCQACHQTKHGNHEHSSMSVTTKKKDWRYSGKYHSLQERAIINFIYMLTENKYVTGIMCKWPWFSWHLKAVIVVSSYASLSDRPFTDGVRLCENCHNVCETINISPMSLCSVYAYLQPVSNFKVRNFHLLFTNLKMAYLIKSCTTISSNNWYILVRAER